ncbi:MAG TPA: antibiotic biosynthesis monooxygenase [Actinobacteria bacterium]|jgi:quinol monooxygenase YgiN|nr:antibiotic biosynthesis monooxygenase [Actinomycetota bacterium]
MPNVWTHGVWTVKEGHEDTFVRAWSGLVREASARFEGSPPILLRDRDRPNVFRTFGSWASIEVVEAFRASELFQHAVGEIRPMLEGLETFTLDEVAWDG